MSDRHNLTDGELATRGDPAGNHGQFMEQVAEDIREHGEVHATFDGTDGEIELRLATTRVNYRRNTFDVWDGDVYQKFSVYQLSGYYKPMDVKH